MTSTESGGPCPDGVFLGYRPQRPWLWLVDIGNRRFDPSEAALPGNDIAVSDIVAMNGWIAVNTHQTPWAIPPALNHKGSRLAGVSFTFAPRLDGETLWIRRGDDPSGDTIAVDQQGEVTDRMHLAEEDRLVGETRMGHLVRRSGNSLALVPPGGGRSELGGTSLLQLIAPDVVAWTDYDQPEVLHLLTPTGRRGVIAPGIVEWHDSASLSPDGRLIAVGGYIDQQAEGPLEFGQGPPERRSALALIDVRTDDVQLADGMFPGFSWTPAWTHDSSWVVFSAPFKSRRLFGTQPTDLTLHEWRFKRSAPSPMLDVTDRLQMPADQTDA